MTVAALYTSPSAARLEREHLRVALVRKDCFQAPPQKSSADRFSESQLCRS
jgi:hypothetical protein